MALPTRPFHDSLPKKDQLNVRLMEFVDSMQEVMDSLIQHGERQTPYYDLDLMSNDSTNGLRDLQRVASILGVKVSTRFGRVMNTNPHDSTEFERQVYHKAIDTAIDYYRSKGLDMMIPIIGYVMRLVMMGKDLNTTDYRLFAPDEEHPVGWSGAVRDDDLGIVTNGGIGPYMGTLAPAPLKPGTVVLSAGAVSVRDDGQGRFSGNGIGTLDYATGEISLRFVTAPPAGIPLTAAFTTLADGQGQFYYRSPHYQIEIDWFASVETFGFSPSYDAHQFMTDLLIILEDTRPAHVVFKILFVICWKLKLNINALLLLTRDIEVPPDYADPWDWFAPGPVYYEYSPAIFLRQMAGGTRIDISIASKVGDLSYSGLRVTGEISTSLGGLSDGPTDWTGATGIVYDFGAEKLYFGYWDGTRSGALSHWLPFLSIDGGGNVETIAGVRGSWRQNVPQAPGSGIVVDTLGDPQSGTFYLSGKDSFQPFLLFRAADNLLDLPGQMIAHAALDA